MRRTRIRLLPKNPHWTEIQKDALKALECSIGLRGLHRPGDVVEIPLTNGHMQKMLRRTKARRSGNHYARACLKELQAMNVIEDTGRIIVPFKDAEGKRRTKRSQNTPRPKRFEPTSLTQPWYRVFRVIPVLRAINSRSSNYPPSAQTSPSPLRVTGCLLSFLRCQGLIEQISKRRSRKRFEKGSVQEAFRMLGPP